MCFIIKGIFGFILMTGLGWVEGVEMGDRWLGSPLEVELCVLFVRLPSEVAGEVTSKVGSGADGGVLSRF